MLETLDKFHKTRPGYILFGLVELGLGLLLANWSVGSGAWWSWLLAIIFLFGFLQNAGKAVMVRTK